MPKLDSRPGLSSALRLPTFSAVIFDMDNLAIDSEPSFIVAWRRAALEFGACLDERLLRGLLGRSADEVVLALGQAIGEGFDGRRFNRLAARCWREHVEAEGISPMPGLLGLLELLRRNRIPYALATNSSGVIAADCLRLSGLGSHFPLAVTREQVSSGKPSPDLFFLAAERLGCPASECLVLEDSAVGLQAAASAGMLPVLVNAKAAEAGLQGLAAMNFLSLHEVADSIKLTLQLGSE